MCSRGNRAVESGKRNSSRTDAGFCGSQRSSKRCELNADTFRRCTDANTHTSHTCDVWRDWNIGPLTCADQVSEANLQCAMRGTNWRPRCISCERNLQQMRQVRGKAQSLGQGRGTKTYAARLRTCCCVPVVRCISQPLGLVLIACPGIRASQVHKGDEVCEEESLGCPQERVDYLDLLPVSGEASKREDVAA